MIGTIVACTAIAVTGIGADIWSTERVFKKYPTGYEVNWHLFGGRRPTGLQLWASDIILNAPYAGIVWYALHNDMPWGAYAAAAILAGWHIVGFIHNVRQQDYSIGERAMIRNLYGKLKEKFEREEIDLIVQWAVIIVVVGFILLMCVFGTPEGLP